MNDITPTKAEIEPAGERTSSRRSRRWAGRLLGVGALLLLGGGVAVGAWRFQAQQQAAVATAELQQDLVPQLRTATVKPGSATVLVSLPGTTLAFTTADIFARASGYVDKRNVDIGDHVKAGQLLAEISAPEIDDQIAQAQATLSQSEAALRQQQANAGLAGVTWGRDKPLVKEGWVTPQQGDVDRQTLRAQQAAVGVAQANIAAQQAQIKVLKQSKDYLSVLAPFDGVVTKRNIDVGSLVQADATSGTFMFTVMQTDVIRTQVYVPQDQAFGVEPGVEAVVRVAELPDRSFPGKVTRIADALDPNTRTLLTEIDVPNPDGTLPPGIYCTVELHIPQKDPSVIVPADAIVFDADGLHVALVKKGIVHMQKVTILRDFGTEVEISDGLEPGDHVVLNPPVNLAEGSRIEARPQPGAPEATASSKND
jgi:RND family efflux transporter MFP subunit